MATASSGSRPSRRTTATRHVPGAPDRSGAGSTSALVLRGIERDPDPVRVRPTPRRAGRPPRAGAPPTVPPTISAISRRRRRPERPACSRGPRARSGGPSAWAGRRWAGHEQRGRRRRGSPPGPRPTPRGERASRPPSRGQRPPSGSRTAGAGRRRPSRGRDGTPASWLRAGAGDPVSCPRRPERRLDLVHLRAVRGEVAVPQRGLGELEVRVGVRRRARRRRSAGRRREAGSGPGVALGPGSGSPGAGWDPAWATVPARAMGPASRPAPRAAAFSASRQRVAPHDRGRACDDDPLELRERRRRRLEVDRLEVDAANRRPARRCRLPRITRAAALVPEGDLRRDRGVLVDPGLDLRRPEDGRVRREPVGADLRRSSARRCGRPPTRSCSAAAARSSAGAAGTRPSARPASA